MHDEHAEKIAGKTARRVKAGRLALATDSAAKHAVLVFHGSSESLLTFWRCPAFMGEHE